MAIANNVALSRITGQYVDFQGNAIAGQVKFTLDELQRNTFADQILVPSTASLTLDSNGEFQVDLPSTTETALTPSGFTYAVEESFSNGATYDISLPVINQAETRANLVTNPSFESSTFGWTPTTATLSLSTDAVFGQFALVMTSTVTAANFGITSANTITGRIPVQPNETYTLSVYAKRGSGTRNLTLRHQGFESPSDVTVINSVTQDFTLTSDWARYSLTATTVFNTYWLDIVIQASNTGAIGNTILVDGILLEKTDTLGSYFDGSVVPTGAGGEVTITSAVESGANTIFTTSAPHNLTVGSDVFITGANSGYWNTGNRTITAITPSTFTCATYAPGFILLRDISGHYATVPDSSALDIVGDIDIRCRIAMDDWTPSALMTLFSKWNATGNQRSYALDLNTNGTLSFFWTPDGSTSNSATSTVAPTVADGAVKWVRATLDVDNGASGRDIQFFTSDDGTTWTQLGTTVTQAGTTSIYAGTASVTVGSTSNGGWSNGAFYRAQILDGIAGTAVLDIDFASARVGLSSTFTAVSGQTVTLEPSTSSTKAVISYFAGNAHRSISYYPQYGGTYQIATLRPTAVITNPQVALAYYAQWVATEAVVTALDVIIDDGDTTFNPTPLELQHLYPAHLTYDLLASAYTNYADLADETTVKITVADVSAVETNVEAQETLALADLATGQTIDGQFIQPLMLVGN